MAKTIDGERFKQMICAAAAAVDERYASWSAGIGHKIRQGGVTMQQLEDYALELGDVSTNQSGRQEYLENVFNAILFGGK